MSVLNSCFFLGIDDLRINKNCSITQVDGKFYLKKYRHFDNDNFEITIIPLEISEKNKVNSDGRKVIIKENIYIDYNVMFIDSLGVKKNEKCSKLLYKESDIIPYSIWINTLKAANFIDSTFFHRYRSVVSFVI